MFYNCAIFVILNKRKSIKNKKLTTVHGMANLIC